MGGVKWKSDGMDGVRGEACSLFAAHDSSLAGLDVGMGFWLTPYAASLTLRPDGWTGASMGPDTEARPTSHRVEHKSSSTLSGSGTQLVLEGHHNRGQGMQWSVAAAPAASSASSKPPRPPGSPGHDCAVCPAKGILADTRIA